MWQSHLYERVKSNIAGGNGFAAPRYESILKLIYRCFSISWRLDPRCRKGLKIGFLSLAQ
jgi:hypothetical protein